MITMRDDYIYMLGKKITSATMFAAQRQYVPHIIHSLILRKYGNEIQKHA